MEDIYSLDGEYDENSLTCQVEMLYSSSAEDSDDFVGLPNSGRGLNLGPVYNDTEGVELLIGVEKPVSAQSPSSSSAQRNHIWEHNATLALLQSMATHMDDLSHPTKKKHVYTNISNDLIGLKYNVTATMCFSKWKGLLRSYKTAKDHKNKTGRGPTRFHFFTEMDDLLGDKPSNSCAHAVASTDVTVILKETPEAESRLSEADKSPICSDRKRKKKHANNRGEDSEKSKERRHQERLEVAKEKLAMEAKKIALLEKFLELQ